MITLLLPVLKFGYLESQLQWLSTQTCRDFTVIVMDSFYQQHRYQPWIARKDLKLIHVPLVHNVGFPKRSDFSIKNNLAFLSPTDAFLFLSDTHYITKDFVANVTDGLLKRQQLAFEPPTVLSNAYDMYRHTVDIMGQTTHIAQPVFVFDRRTFFYVLNGFDEAFTYVSDYEYMAHRMLNACGVFQRGEGLYHILHSPSVNQFGRSWRKPCEKCDQLFARWKFDRAYDTGEFPVESCDPEMLTQLCYRDPELGIEVFQCHNCGFGGLLNPAEYEKQVERQRITGAPASAFDGRTGRNLAKIYETMGKQVANDVQAKLAYLRTTY